MALQEPNRETLALRDALATASHQVVADFLDANPKAMRTFVGLSNNDYRRMIDYMRSDNEYASEKARTRLDDSLEFVWKIPTWGLKLTQGVREYVVRAQRNDEFFALMSSVRNSLRQPLRSAIKIPAEIYALSAATLGFDKQQRVDFLKGFSAPVFIAAGLSVGLPAGTATAAISPDAAGHTDTAPNGANLASRLGPLEITVTRGKATQAFDSVIKVSPLVAERLTPALAQLMKRSPDARALVAKIETAALKHGLDPVLGANQLFKETSFIPDYLSGKVASPAGAIGPAQIMPETGAEYGYTVEDLKDTDTALEAWGRIMSRLTKKLGDQRFAAVAYNGGTGSINFVKEELGLKKITVDQWIDFMIDRRADMGTKIASAWHVETLEYVMTISPEYRATLAKIKDSEAQAASAALYGDYRRVPLPEPAPRG